MSWASPGDEPTVDERGLVVRSAPAHVPGGPRSVVDLVTEAARRRPHDLALVTRSGPCTHAELAAEVETAAAVLAAAGVGPGDRVAAALGNDTAVVVAFVATLRIGAIWVGMHPRWAVPETAHALADAGARLLLVESGAESEVHAGVRVLGVGGAEWRTMAGAAPVVADRPVDPHAPAVIAYTSGTTGRPKGAVHSQHNLVWPGACLRDDDPPGPDERIGVCLALTVVNLMVLGPLWAWIRGVPCVVMDRTDPLGIAEWVGAEAITRMTAVPTLVHDLLASDAIDPVRDLANLRALDVGGAGTSPGLRRRWLDTMGWPLHTSYGLTESPTGVARERPGRPLRPGTTGWAVPAVEVAVVDDTGRPLPPGAEGEIVVAPRTEGAWAGVWVPTLGYWHRPEATRRLLAGGVLHTGDVGVLDADGYLTVLDRRSDLIVRGGANVYPAEVEAVLVAHPSVADAAVVGVPDERLGRRVVALVVPVPGAVVDAEALAGHCRAALSGTKVPAEFRVVADLARNPMGKLDRARLAAEVGGRGEVDAGPQEA